MVVLLFGFELVIDINFDVFAYLAMEHSIHKPLIGCPCALQSERHQLVTEESSADDEGHLFLISFVHYYLVVT